MAKKKKTPPQPQLSPEKYIRLKARTLPVVACYINENWQECGEAHILVVRSHKSGNYTVGGYLVDTYCLGVKDTFCSFNISSFDLNVMLRKIPNRTETTYNEAHNIIYGALTYAEEEAGVTAHPSFRLAQYMLEEDTDEIPLIEYEFGKDQRPFLIVGSQFEANKYLPALRKIQGDDVPFLIADRNLGVHEKAEDANGLSPDGNSPFADKLLAAMERIKVEMLHFKDLAHTTYAYIHPQYPSVLEITHSELEVIRNPAYIYSLPREVIEQLLALPRESLIADLNHIILYELGRTCDTITDNMYQDSSNAITHALFLLGELKAAESLQTVLEILRQNNASLDFHFSDARTDTFLLTLYYVGRNQTDELLAFMKEPGLDSFARTYVPPVLALIAINEPDRRGEVIDWLRQLIGFLVANVADDTVFDATLAGSIPSVALDIKAEELLPDLKELYDTEQVDCMRCGDYAKVENAMRLGRMPLINYSVADIYQRYRNYEKDWNRH